MAKKIYPRTIRKIILAVLDTFNTLTSEVEHPEGTFTDKVVPIIFSSKEKYLGFLKKPVEERERYRISLPGMACELTSLDSADDRKMNQNIRITSCDTDKTEQIMHPIPYDFTFDISIFSKFYNELLLVLEQILSKFNNTIYYPFIEYKFVSGDQIERSLPITLQAPSLNVNTVDIGQEDETVYQVTLTFVVKGWVYSTTEVDAGNEFGVINQIDVNFENDEELRFELVSIYKDTGGDTVVDVTEGENTPETG
jgi:hypothetical protein